MSADNSVTGKEILKTTPKESDNTKPKSSEQNCTNFDAKERSKNTAEITQTLQVGSESVAELTSRDVLYTQACKEMSDYAKCYVGAYQSIIQLTLNKLKLLPQKSVVLQTKMLELESVLAQIESIDLKADFVYDDDLYAIVREIGKVEDEYVAMKTNVQYKSEADLLQRILKEVGFEAQEQRLTEARRLLVKNFANALDNFNATISDAERTTEWELVEFYERFNAITDFQEQYNYFDEFWPIFW
ncbi:uncharacterized protein LOC115066585 [Bactrocera dorsalis]|uniref:Uncharacterized protein LOC115066585 n=1 Tax=Bactrocera dorsalis TaxID=27457 RepID=A0A8N4QI83_BACDO|nr:uncharacterized protein LOC115066585 [Bactrocera dorsalis]